MPERQDATKPTLVRAVIEVAFILFLFYANLLMGEFTRRSAPGKTLGFALRDILTGKNLAIGLVAALVGWPVFEYLRRTFGRR
jgi:ABC-type Fe3+-siderophore transport system permease subunit